jgi:outer membrane biosynthesis protein TonB
MAYFAGAGTVVVAIAAGIGGGLTIANIVSPHASHQEMSKLEQRMQADRASDPVKDASQPSQPSSYLAATQPAAGATVVQPPVKSPQPSQTEASNPAPQPANPAPQPAPSPTTTANDVAAKPVEASTPKPATPTAQGNSDQQASTSQTSTSQDAMAKARDADAKRLAEKRKADRHQQWADRRRYRDLRERDVRDVDPRVREDAEPRVGDYIEPRDSVDVPVREESPQIRLFGPN